MFSFILQNIEEKYKGRQPKLNDLSSIEKTALWNCDVKCEGVSKFIITMHETQAISFLANLWRKRSDQQFLSSVGDDDFDKVKSLCTSSIKNIRKKALMIKTVIEESKKRIENDDEMKHEGDVLHIEDYLDEGEHILVSERSDVEVDIPENDDRSSQKDTSTCNVREEDWLEYLPKLNTEPEISIFEVSNNNIKNNGVYL